MYIETSQCILKNIATASSDKINFYARKGTLPFKPTFEQTSSSVRRYSALKSDNFVFIYSQLFIYAKKY